MADRITLYCPECRDKLVFKGYRTLFPVCRECDRGFHIERCIEKNHSGSTASLD